MTQAAGMLRTYPGDLGQVDRQALATCIDACFECAQTCTACADACLSEQMVAEMVKCVRSNLDCADICDATGRVLSRHTGYDANLTRTIVEACAVACRACGDECQRHARTHQHCRVCVEACRRCERACQNLLSSLGLVPSCEYHTAGWACLLAARPAVTHSDTDRHPGSRGGTPKERHRRARDGHPISAKG